MYGTNFPFIFVNTSIGFLVSFLSLGNRQGEFLTLFPYIVAYIFTVIWKYFQHRSLRIFYMQYKCGKYAISVFEHIYKGINLNAIILGYSPDSNRLYYRNSTIYAQNIFSVKDQRSLENFMKNLSEKNKIDIKRQTDGSSYINSKEIKTPKNVKFIQAINKKLQEDYIIRQKSTQRKGLHFETNLKYIGKFERRFQQVYKERVDVEYDRAYSAQNLKVDLFFYNHNPFKLDSCQNCMAVFNSDSKLLEKIYSDNQNNNNHNTQTIGESQSPNKLTNHNLKKSLFSLDNVQNKKEEQRNRIMQQNLYYLKQNLEKILNTLGKQYLSHNQCNKKLSKQNLDMMQMSQSIYPQVITPDNEQNKQQDVMQYYQNLTSCIENKIENLLHFYFRYKQKLPKELLDIYRVIPNNYEFNLQNLMEEIQYKLSYKKCKKNLKTSLNFTDGDNFSPKINNNFQMVKQSIMIVMNNAYKYAVDDSLIEINIEDAKFKQIININILNTYNPNKIDVELIQQQDKQRYLYKPEKEIRPKLGLLVCNDILQQIGPGELKIKIDNKTNQIKCTLQFYRDLNILSIKGQQGKEKKNYQNQRSSFLIIAPTGKNLQKKRNSLIVDQNNFLMSSNLNGKSDMQNSFQNGNINNSNNNNLGSNENLGSNQLLSFTNLSPKQLMKSACQERPQMYKQCTDENQKNPYPKPSKQDIYNKKTFLSYGSTAHLWFKSHQDIQPQHLIQGKQDQNEIDNKIILTNNHNMKLQNIGQIIIKNMNSFTKLDSQQTIQINQDLQGQNGVNTSNQQFNNQNNLSVSANQSKIQFLNQMNGDFEIQYDNNDFKLFSNSKNNSFQEISSNNGNYQNYRIEDKNYYQNGNGVINNYSNNKNNNHIGQNEITPLKSQNHNDSQRIMVDKNIVYNEEEEDGLNQSPPNNNNNNNNQYQNNNNNNTNNQINYTNETPLKLNKKKKVSFHDTTNVQKFYKDLN